MSLRHYSEDKSIVATADAGPDSMIVLWNTITGQPVHTIASPHPGGVLGMDISPSVGSTGYFHFWRWGDA